MRHNSVCVALAAGAPGAAAAALNERTSTNSTLHIIVSQRRRRRWQRSFVTLFLFLAAGRASHTKHGRTGKLALMLLGAPNSSRFVCTRRTTIRCKRFNPLPNAAPTSGAAQYKSRMPAVGPMKRNSPTIVRTPRADGGCETDVAAALNPVSWRGGCAKARQNRKIFLLKLCAREPARQQNVVTLAGERTKNKFTTQEHHHRRMLATRLPFKPSCNPRVHLCDKLDESSSAARALPSPCLSRRYLDVCRPMAHHALGLSGLAMEMEM